MINYLDETQVEIVTMEHFRELGYEYLHGDRLLPNRLSGEVECPAAEEVS